MSGKNSLEHVIPGLDLLRTFRSG